MSLQCTRFILIPTHSYDDFEVFFQALLSTLRYRLKALDGSIACISQRLIYGKTVQQNEILSYTVEPRTIELPWAEQ